MRYNLTSTLLSPPQMITICKMPFVTHGMDKPLNHILHGLRFTHAVPMKIVLITATICEDALDGNGERTEMNATFSTHATEGISFLLLVAKSVDGGCKTALKRHMNGTQIWMQAKMRQHR
mmetsp:Transcript_2182/g.3768  ORF Transcript_2182/g.3768 Transcript_2182/m.3768 type:complete len:120 (-) Transcript_2182:24-383(-)